MQMIGHAGARALAKIQPDVESLRFHRLAQKALGMHREVPKFEHFVFA